MTSPPVEPRDKTTTIEEALAQLESGMTIGIGGWGSRRKPMAMVRAIARSSLKDLEIVSYGGPDVGILCATGQARRIVYGFVSLDSIPLEPHFRAARQNGTVEVVEYDEGMLYWALFAAANRLPFLPTIAGLGSSILEANPQLQLVTDPYGGQQLVAVPAQHLDAAIVHLHRADARGNAQYLGPDLYFDDLFLSAADRRIVTCEKVVPTDVLLDEGPLQSLRINRSMVDMVVATPNGAHFTTCAPDYGRDEAFQADYAASARSDQAWTDFRERWLEVDEATYQQQLTDQRTVTS